MKKKMHYVIVGILSALLFEYGLTAIFGTSPIGWYENLIQGTVIQHYHLDLILLAAVMIGIPAYIKYKQKHDKPSD